MRTLILIFIVLQGKRTREELYEPTPKMHAFMAPWVQEKYQHGMQGGMM
jgi:hypothetical protein